MALYRATGRDRYLEAAVRAADWLAEIQNVDGGWSRHTFQGLARAYHARVAWAVLSVHRQAAQERHRRCGERHVEWVLSQATGADWFRKMAFDDASDPLTHTIAYTLRGLWECTRLLRNEQAEQLVVRACDGIIDRYRLAAQDPSTHGPAFLPATLDENWNPADGSYSCLTGNAQLAMLWLKLYRAEGGEGYRTAAGRLIEGVKTVQSLTSGSGAIRGAVPGSRPHRGRYLSYTYPNWATKFFTDALMARLSLDRAPGEDDL
jgi:hypothetical protein